MSTQELGSPAAAAWALLQFVALGFAVVLSRKMPAASVEPAVKAPPADSPAAEEPPADGRTAGGEPDEKAPPPGEPAASVKPIEKAPPPGGPTTGEPPSPAAAKTTVLPAADQTVDVSAFSAGASRLYWLAVAVKFGALMLALGILARNNDPENGVFQLTWGKGITVGVGALVALGLAVLLQEGWVRPTAVVVLGLGLITAVCFVPVPFGALTTADAEAGVIFWAMWPLFALWLYRRWRRSSGLSDVQIQAVGRVGHLPQRRSARTGHRTASLARWIRGSIGVLCAIPLVLMGLANKLIPYPIVPDWIQAGLDSLYARARRSVRALSAGLASGERVTMALVESLEPGAWSLKVRGDLIQWGKLGVQSVPFEEFLRVRLEAYGDVLMIDQAPRRAVEESGKHAPSVVVMPVGVPHCARAVDEVVALGARTPLLLLLEPTGSSQGQPWLSLVCQLRDRGIILPTLDEPGRTIAVLHRATGANTAYVGSDMRLWGYLAAIHEALREVGSEPGRRGRTQAADSPYPPDSSKSGEPARSTEDSRSR